MKIFVKGKGEGQGSCDICDSKGFWNRHWMVMLYKEVSTGLYYCGACLNELDKYEVREDNNNDIN